MKIIWPSTAVLTFLLLLSGCAGTPERPRSTGAWIDDNILEVAIEREIRASDEAYKGALLVVVVYDGLVLLLGQVPSEQLKAQAAAVAAGAQTVGITSTQPAEKLAQAGCSIAIRDFEDPALAALLRDAWRSGPAEVPLVL